ncbi:MAG: DUF1016 N-terminal domain-containing protein, partial [Angustibacter sp.]
IMDDTNEYQELLTEIAEHLNQGAARARAAVGLHRLLSYHAIGASIIRKQAEQGWGTQVVDRLSADLRVRFPGQRGLSPRNLHYMRSLALGWPDGNFAAAAAKLP